MQMIRIFALIALTPVLLIALGIWLGGWLPLAALLYITLIAFAADEGVSAIAPAADPEADFTWANRLSVALALAHFVLLGGVVWALSHDSLDRGGKITLYFAAALFMGQVSNSNAHELIHRPKRGLFELGKWVYISLLFGHHTSAHIKIHHRFVASPRDPNSAREGESFYRFAPRAWIGSFRAGYEIERADLARASRRRLHPYLTYLAGAMGMLAIAAWIGGTGGVLAYLCLAGYAQMQLLLSDYVQHYGLKRAELRPGKLEPVGPQHSWNAPHWFTTHLMLNAPRHSDHHARPACPYPALRLREQEAPMLPWSLPVMATLALIPPLWRRVMRRELRKWHATHPRTAPQV